MALSAFPSFIVAVSIPTSKKGLKPTLKRYLEAKTWLEGVDVRFLQAPIGKKIQKTLLALKQIFTPREFSKSRMFPRKY